MAATDAPEPVLLMAMELGQSKWQLGFSTPQRRAMRRRRIDAGDVAALGEELERAREKLGLSASAATRSCYEAGRDGFWIHRWLQTLGVKNVVVDPSSIEVNRRARRTKTDRVDLEKLMGMLRRYQGGERGLWAVVKPPSAPAEDDRQIPRHVLALKADATRISNRIQGLLAAQGVDLPVDHHLGERLEQVRLWNGEPLPAQLHRRLQDDLAQWQLIRKQIDRIEAERQARLARAAERRASQRRRRRSKGKGKSPKRSKSKRSSAKEQAPNAAPAEDTAADVALTLMSLRGIGEQSGWLLSTELFAWREFRNRKQVGAMVGVSPTPYDSGESQREQGISRSGNSRVRTMVIQIAWGWLRFQPNSELSRWFRRRFDHGRRYRKVGIVALARRLLVSLWRYLQTGEPPVGAVLG